MRRANTTHYAAAILRIVYLRHNMDAYGVCQAWRFQSLWPHYYFQKKVPGPKSKGRGQLLLTWDLEPETRDLEPETLFFKPTRTNH